MNDTQQKAFVEAYLNHVGHLPENIVTDFVKRYEAGEDIDYSFEHTSIMDSLGIWHEAIKWKLNELIKNS
jgi:hypothetical protein